MERRRNRWDEHRYGHVLVSVSQAEDTYRMAVNGIPVVSNLDAALELRNSAGQLIASANPQDTRNATIVKGLDTG